MSKKMDIYAELDDFVEENEGQVTLTDVAKHFADYGYQYAIDKVCDILNHYCNRSGVHPSWRVDMIDHIRKAMEE